MLKAIVATSALELGVDWGDVDLVIQVGAPKGVSRLLQRIGRSNHRLDEPSKALLVPSNRFEALECQSAITAIEKGELDGEPMHPGALDILPQFIINCACHQPAHPDDIYAQVTSSYPYRNLDREQFDQLWQFAVDGGYALRAYDRYQRLQVIDGSFYEPVSKRVIQRHRQNIGTIVEAGRLKVKRIRRGNQGKVIGEVEEYFAQQLVPGDTFYFAGEILQFEAIRDMQVHARPSKAKDPKIPSYVGGQMPLSTYLADGVRALLNEPSCWQFLPEQVKEWLSLQAEFSHIPTTQRVLVEQFPHRKSYYTLFYTFVCALKPISEGDIDALFQPDILGDELEDWMLAAPMLKRAFRQIAVVSGLTEQRYHSAQKTMKQVTFSTDLIYDTLREYDPDHILLTVTRAEAERELLDLRRLADTLIRFVGQVDFVDLLWQSP
jgi:ATP-dependent Lhr-like helicase